MGNEITAVEMGMIFGVQSLMESISCEEANLQEARIQEGMEMFPNVHPTSWKAKKARAALKVLRANLKRLQIAPKRDERYPDQATYPFPNWKLNEVGQAVKHAANDQSYDDAMQTHELYKRAMGKIRS